MKGMKVYITARFRQAKKDEETDKLCRAVREAAMQDFCFTRDVTEHFDNPKNLWQRAYDELQACDALLIDVTDRPTGGRVIEVGMAFALHKRIFVVVRKGVEYKGMFDGIASTVIEYENYKDLTRELKKYDRDSNFDFTDRTMMFVLVTLLGLGLAWGLAVIFLPLGFIGAIVYWFIARHFIGPLKAFDRIAILIPLAVIWLVGMGLLYHVYYALAVGWTVMYWLVALTILKKLKLSL